MGTLEEIFFSAALGVLNAFLRRESPASVPSSIFSRKASPLEVRLLTRKRSPKSTMSASRPFSLKGPLPTEVQKHEAQGSLHPKPTRVADSMRRTHQGSWYSALSKLILTNSKAKASQGLIPTTTWGDKSL